MVSEPAGRNLRPPRDSPGAQRSEHPGPARPGSIPLPLPGTNCPSQSTPWTTPLTCRLDFLPVRQSLQEITSSCLFVFGAGLALWPPGLVYWSALASVVGDGPTLVLVALLAVAIAAGFVWLTRVRVRSFVGGGGLAYALWMLGIEATSSPDSPVHFLWYAVLLGSFVAGAVLAAGIADDSDRSRTESSE